MNPFLMETNAATAFIRSTMCQGSSMSRWETKAHVIDLVFMLDFLGAATEVKHGALGGASSWDDLAADFPIASCFTDEAEAVAAIHEAGQTVQSLADHAADALDSLADVEL